jgi:phosphatidate cytidylyltransferase
MSSDSKYNDLKSRSISALVMALIAGGSLWAGGNTFLVVLLAVAFCIMWEICGLSPSDSGLRIAVSFIFMVSLGAAFWTNQALSLGIFAASIVGYIILLRPKDPVLRIGLALLSYGGLLTLAWLRTEIGIIPTIWVICCVIASDIGGYFAGRTFGGPKLWPAVSPKKTWSGTIGGWVLAVVVTIIFALMGDIINLGHAIGAVLIAIFAQAGDLAESALKRRAGVKDSSNLIPGHGGFLDRFDGMLGAFFLIFLLSIFGLQGLLF